MIKRRTSLSFGLLLFFLWLPQRTHGLPTTHPPWTRPPHTACAFSVDRRPWYDKVVFAKVEKILESDEIVDIKVMRSHLVATEKNASGSTGALLLTFRSGPQGVWKDNRNGNADGEISAYRAVRYLHGLRNVPPTVYRDIAKEMGRFRIDSEALSQIQGTLGSVQYFIPTAIDMNRKDIRESIWPLVPAWQKGARDIFRFTYGQNDPNWGNIIVDEGYNTGWIDNADICGSQQINYGENPFRVAYHFKKEIMAPDWPEAFPFHTAIHLSRPSLEDFVRFLKPWVNESNSQRFWAFQRDYITDQSMDIVFWRNQVWVRGRGFKNHAPVRIDSIRESTLRTYRALTKASLRSVLVGKCLNDDKIEEILLASRKIIQAIPQQNVIRD